MLHLMKYLGPFVLPLSVCRSHPHLGIDLLDHQKQFPNQLLALGHRPFPFPIAPGGLITVCPRSANTTSTPAITKIARAISTATSGGTNITGGQTIFTRPSNTRST